MNRILIAAGVALIAIAGGVFWYKRAHQDAPIETAATAGTPITPAAPPPIAHPIATPPADATAPLPGLKESDAPLTTELGTLFGADNVAKYLVPDSVVRRLVASIDNLPRRKIADRLRPVQPLAGSFAVARSVADTEETLVLSPDNYSRYEPLVKLLQGADAQQVATLYRRFYPLFQQQYEELGFPDQYFNDRLVAVIDHLLQAPDVQDPVRLVQPNVFYEYADPGLEARSSGQKLLIRMGPQNAAAVKAKLRELRAAITAGAPAKP
jgi:hypothetical protein